MTFRHPGICVGLALLAAIALSAQLRRANIARRFRPSAIARLSRPADVRPDRRVAAVFRPHRRSMPDDRLIQFARRGVVAGRAAATTREGHKRRARLTADCGFVLCRVVLRQGCEIANRGFVQYPFDKHSQIPGEERLGQSQQLQIIAQRHVGIAGRQHDG